MSVKKLARPAVTPIRAKQALPLAAFPQAPAPISSTPVTLKELRESLEAKGVAWKEPKLLTLIRAVARLEARTDPASVLLVTSYLDPNRGQLEVHLVDKDNNRVALNLPGTLASTPQPIASIQAALQLKPWPADTEMLARLKLITFEQLGKLLQIPGYRVEWVAKIGEQCLVLDLACQAPRGLGPVGGW